MVKLANEIDEPYDISQQRKLVTRRDELRPVQGVEEDTGGRVITPHTDVRGLRSRFRGDTVSGAGKHVPRAVWRGVAALPPGPR